MSLAADFLEQWEGRTVDLSDIEAEVRRILGDRRTTRHQLAALVAFRWLVGPSVFLRSDALHWHRKGAFETASHAFDYKGRTTGQIKMLAALGRLYRGEE